MARGINSVLLIGALTRDPELRYTPNGAAVLSLTVAGDSVVTDIGGDVRSLPWYQRVELVSRSAEALQEQLKAGSSVLVEGKLDYQSWENEAGERRSKVIVRANRIDPLAPNQRSEQIITDKVGGYRLLDAINQTVISGNLARDPVIRHTQNGHSVASFAVAVTESWKDVQGEWQQKPHYIDVTLWHGLADAAANLQKGDPVMISGRLTNDSWTDASGVKRYSTKLEAERMELLQRRTQPEAQPVAQLEPEPAALPKAAKPRNRATAAAA